VGGEGVAQGVGGGAFGDTGGADGAGDGSLDAAGMLVVALDGVGARVYR